MSAQCRAIWDRIMGEIRAAPLARPSYPVLIVLGDDVGPAASRHSVALVGPSFWTEEQFRDAMAGWTDRVIARYFRPAAPSEAERAEREGGGKESEA